MKTAEQVPPHAPVPGRFAKILGTFHVTGYFWYRIHEIGVSILPN